MINCESRLIEEISREYFFEFLHLMFFFYYFIVVIFIYFYFQLLCW